MTKKPNSTDSIREYVRKTYLEPARKRGLKQVRVSAGEVHSGLGLRNRVPMVCSALRSKELLREAHVRILKDEGPPSGQSTTVGITYEVLHEKAEIHKPAQSRTDIFHQLRGIAKDVFRELGGGEEFIKSERRQFSQNERKR
jgi:hypothetical protein